MTLQYLRDAVTASLQKRIDAAAEKAINMRVNMTTSADGYALTQADVLAEARTYAEAQKIVIAEYKRLTEAEKPASEADEQPQKAVKEKIYG